LPERQLESSDSESLLINEAQFLLARKRTLLAQVRTGLAVLAVPLSVVSLLIVTSRYYHFYDNIWYLIPLFVVCLSLVCLGGCMIIRAFYRLHRTDRGLRAVVEQSPHLNRLVQ
jgi:uncharacterized membrane protein YidH (DUF202 family)